MARRKPTTILVGDDKYVATVFKVDEHDPDGVPRKLTMVGDNEEITLEGGEHFVIMYMLFSMRRQSKGDA